MFWCTLYMQSDKNINQGSVKMMELRWKNNYLTEMDK